MAYIDPHYTASLSGADSAAPAQSEQQRSDWLQALESSGWHDILAGMHNFSGASPFTGRSDERADYVLDQAKTAANIDGDAIISSMHPVDAMSVSDGGGTLLNAAQVARATSAPYQPAYAFAQGRMVYGIGDDDETPHQAGCCQVVSNEADPLPTQKMLVLPTGENGVEVWVRDAGMNEVQLQLLLADVRRNIRNQGSELTKVSLNGREVYASRQDRVESGNSKGD